MLTHNNHNNITLLLCMLFLCTSAIQLPSKVENPTPHIIVTNGPFEFPTGRSSKRASIYGSDLSPAEFKTMYNMDQSLSAGAGKTIAIIGAYAQASLEADLAFFSTRYDLPACSTANGCFKRVSQTGDANYPTETDPDWGQEACLDVQWAHAIAPGAKKIFVEAKSDTYDDLMAAVNYASKHADYVSMSFGGAEFAKNPAFESIFATAGVSFFASSGDDGSGVNYPAASPYVISVGGTTLYKSSTTGGFAAERGWSGSGGGCSEYYSASTVQLPYSTSLCGKKRAVPDVAFAASPYSGVLVYVSQGCENSPSCWFSIGGTSLAAPVFAARSAVRSAIVKPAYVYGNNIVWRDVKVGNNGFSCLTGYDLVTGRGAWIGDVSSASTKAPSTKA